MENKNDTAFDDSYDTLSLRDLPIYDDINAANSLRSSPRTSTSAQDLFEFFSGIDPYPARPDIIFCGKIIPYEYEENDNNLALTKSTSFRFRRPERCVSDRVPGSEPSPVMFSTSVKKVNITSLTTMSAKSRRRMFMFGPVKFKPEMELSAIRERQGRRAPLPMFPALVGGDEMVGSGGGKGRCSHSSHWGIVRTLKCRAQRDYLSTVLARSLGCIPTY